MNVVGERAVDEYLTRLERSLGDLPASRRRELVDEIEEHIADTVAELEPDATEADVRNALDRLGEPDDIASEARERLGVRPPRASWTDPAAISLLLVGGFLWGIGWVVGVVFLWLSDVWSTRDKIIGTLVTPLGLAMPFLIAVFVVGSRVCGESGRTVNGVTTTTSSSCSGGWSSDVLATVVWILLTVAPIVTAIYLGRKLRRARVARG